MSCTQDVLATRPASVDLPRPARPSQSQISEGEAAGGDGSESSGQLAPIFTQDHSHWWRHGYMTCLQELNVIVLGKVKLKRWMQLRHDEWIMARRVYSYIGTVNIFGTVHITLPLACAIYQSSLSTPLGPFKTSFRISSLIDLDAYRKNIGRYINKFRPTIKINLQVHGCIVYRKCISPWPSSSINGPQRHWKVRRRKRVPYIIYNANSFISGPRYPHGRTLKEKPLGASKYYTDDVVCVCDRYWP